MTFREKMIARLSVQPQTSDALTMFFMAEAHPDFTREQIRDLHDLGLIYSDTSGLWHLRETPIEAEPHDVSPEPALRAAVDSTRRALEEYLGHTSDPVLVALMAAVEAAETAHDRIRGARR